MDKTELKSFNKQLIDDFGYFDATRPKFRLVWSHDEFEQRLVDHSDEGFQLLSPKIVNKPKYRQWCDNRWVLEKCTEVPTGHTELTVQPISWENIWTFQNRNGEYLEPNYLAAKFVINTILGVTFSPSNMAKYNTTNEQERQQRIKEIDEIEELLYGNESKVGDALAKDSAVGYGTRNRSDSFDPKQKMAETMKELG
jgi:hypothetical protein